MSNQTFQVIYIDDESKSDKDKIVLIEETQESLPEATGILNTLEKESKYGIVATGSAIAIAELRASLYDYDKENNLGSKETVDILKETVDVIFASGCEVAYYKSPQSYEPIPEEMKNISVAFDFKKMFTDLGKGIKENWEKGVEKTVDDINKMSDEDFKELTEYLNKNEKSYIELEKVLKKSNSPSVKKLMNLLDSIEVDDINEYHGAEFDGFKHKIKAGIDQTIETIVDLITKSYFENDKERVSVNKPIKYKDYLKEMREKNPRATEEKIKDSYKIEITEIENDNKEANKINDELIRSIKSSIVKNIVNIGFLKDGNTINKKEALLITHKPIKVNKNILDVSDPVKLKLEDIKKYDYSEYKDFEKKSKVR